MRAHALLLGKSRELFAASFLPFGAVHCANAVPKVQAVPRALLMLAFGRSWGQALRTGPVGQFFVVRSSSAPLGSYLVPISTNRVTTSSQTQKWGAESSSASKQSFPSAAARAATAAGQQPVWPPRRDATRSVRRPFEEIGIRPARQIPHRTPSAMSPHRPRNAPLQPQTPTGTGKSFSDAWS